MWFVPTNCFIIPSYVSLSECFFVEQLMSPATCEAIECNLKSLKFVHYKTTSSQFQSCWKRDEVSIYAIRQTSGGTVVLWLSSRLLKMRQNLEFTCSIVCFYVKTVLAILARHHYLKELVELTESLLAPEGWPSRAFAILNKNLMRFLVDMFTWTPASCCPSFSVGTTLATSCWSRSHIALNPPSSLKELNAVSLDSRNPSMALHAWLTCEKA